MFCTETFLVGTNLRFLCTWSSMRGGTHLGEVDSSVQSWAGEDDHGDKLAQLSFGAEGLRETWDVEEKSWPHIGLTIGLFVCKHLLTEDLRTSSHDVFIIVTILSQTTAHLHRVETNKCLLICEHRRVNAVWLVCMFAGKTIRERSRKWVNKYKQTKV